MGLGGDLLEPPEPPAMVLPAPGAAPCPAPSARCGPAAGVQEGESQREGKRHHGGPPAPRRETEARQGQGDVPMPTVRALIGGCDPQGSCTPRGDALGWWGLSRAVGLGGAPPGA
ncbi:hypothetical protein LUU34_00698000 [Aix galericulata]|nr:hypothetical protein LUU34_00698000 [Aix galericulata]